MSEQTQNAEQKTVKIEDKVYAVDSLTEAGANLINNVQAVDQLIARHQFELNVAGTAKAALMEQLIKEAANFTEVQNEPAVEADA